MKNKAGNFVAPTLASTSAAAEGVDGARQPRHQDQQPRGARTAYPITSQTFVVVYKDMCKAGVPGGEAAAKGVVQFLDYGLGSEGQSILAQADYAALPAAILAKSKEAVDDTAVQRLGPQRLIRRVMSQGSGYAMTTMEAVTMRVELMPPAERASDGSQRTRKRIGGSI